MRIALSALAVLFAAPAAQAVDVEVRLVKDIATGPASASSSPLHLRQFGGRVYFNAETPLLGRELYVSDGVSAQAQLVHDFAAGTASSFAKAIGLAGGRLVVEADNGIQGNALLALDRDSGATATLLGFGGAGGYDMRAKPVAQLAGRLLFRTQEHLYTTDGTAAGTQPLFDQPYSARLGDSVCVLGSGAMLVAPASGADQALWHTSGTRSSNRVVFTLPQGEGLAAVSGNGSQCYFLTSRNGGGWYLRRSDGNGVTLVAAQGTGYAQGVAAAGNFAYVTDGGTNGVPYRLWRSDVSQPLASYALQTYDLAYMRAVGDRLVFNGPYQDGSNVRSAIFVSDGTAAGTQRLGPAEGLSVLDDVYLQAVSGNSLLVAGSLGIWKIDPAARTLLRVGDGLEYASTGAVLNGAFIAGHRTDDAGTEVFRSDGSTPSPVLLHDVYQANAGSLSRYAYPSASIGSTLYFNNVLDGQPSWGGRTALWRTDGSEAGTQPMPRSVYGEGPAHDVVRFGDRIVFSTWPPPTTANSYFLSDAAFATTSNLVAGSSDHVLQSYGPDGAGGVLMSCRLAGPGSNSNLCAVRAGESQAALIAPNLLSYGQVFSIGSAGNVALFFLDDYTHVEQRGLWRSDGTAPGTFRIHPDLRRTGASGSGGVASYALPDRMLFDACNSPAAECGLYVTDGTQAGTHFVTALPARVDQFVALGERIALMVGEGDQQQLWISDGTAAGTDLLRSFAGRPVSSVASFGDRLHFIVGMPGPVNLSPEYYLSDGRKDGTHSVVLPAGLRPEILPIARLDADTAVFNCSTVATGSELCAIAKDGSGAHLIMDILPGPNSSGATLIGSTADATYYAADDGYRGNELWQLRSRSDRLFRDGFQ